MPAKRVILLDRDLTEKTIYHYLLWADVPVANQAAYRNPTYRSQCSTASPTETQALRDGLVAERRGTFQSGPSTPLSTVLAALEVYWQRFQDEITAYSAWGEYGKFWDGAAWQPSPGVPFISSSDSSIPTFWALTGISLFAANKFQFVLYNGVSSSTSLGLIIKVHLLVVLPGLAVVTGVAPSAWVLRRREAPTTPPAGGAIAVVSADSAFSLPTGISAHNAPSTAPAGGTPFTFLEFVPQADEQKLTTFDAPTAGATLSDFAGDVIYRAGALPSCQPITIRPGQSIEVQQSATAGTGNCRILCVFTIG